MLETAAVIAALSACASVPPGLTVHLDARAREVVLRSPSVDLPHSASPTGYQGYHHHAAVTPLLPFAWPVDGWVRGFRLRVLDCAGNEVSKTRLHHSLLLHLGRPELMCPIYERLGAFGRETEDIVMPRGVGIKLANGDSLGWLAAWMPVTGGDRVVLELTIPYLPATTNPRPVEIVPVGFDVRYEAGEGASYDVPPGRSTRERVFQMPLSGRILVAGGHLHDYARSMTLTDVETGKIIVNVRPRLDDRGRMIRVERNVYGAVGDGVKLEAGRRYRLSVTYDNPTGDTLVQGAMGILVGLFAPRDPTKWPVLDPGSKEFQLDVDMLARSGFIPRR